MRIVRRIMPLVYLLVFIALAIYRLIVLNSDVLYEAQEQSYWQPGEQFWKEMLSQPGGVLSWLGCYLTQYFYHPALGASILILLWSCIYGALYKALSLPWYLAWIALIPSLMLLWTETSLGYAIYVMVIPDWWFTPTLFLFILSLLALGCGLLTKKLKIHWFLNFALIFNLINLCFILFAGPWIDATLMPSSMFHPFHAMAGDDNYQREMRMYRAVEEGRWTEVVGEYSKAKENPTRAMWIMKDIALSNRNRLDQDWLKYNNAIQQQASNDSILPPLSASIAPLAYYQHGCIGFSYRWAMENNVQYGITYQRLRMMVRCALVKGEYKLADKYLTQLERTVFQSRWAKEQRQYITHPEKLANDPIYARALSLSAHFDDALDGDNGDIESYLTRLYGLYRGEMDETMSQLCMMYAIQSRDLMTFWSQFSIYAASHQGKPMPKLYQEIAILYGQLDRSVYDPSHLPFSDEVRNSGYRFITQYMQLSSARTPAEKTAQSTKREFGHTAYWYYYFNK